MGGGDDGPISAAGVIDHEAQYGDDDYLCYADHRFASVLGATLCRTHQSFPNQSSQSLWAALGVADRGLLQSGQRLGGLGAESAPELVRREFRVAQLSAQPRWGSLESRHPTGTLFLGQLTGLCL